MTDAYKIVKYQSQNKVFEKMKLTDFADRLAWDLIYNNDRKEARSTFISSLQTQPSVDGIEVSCVTITSPTSAVSSVSGTSSGEQSGLMKHKLKKSDKREGDKSQRFCRQACITCGKKCSLYCEHPMCLHSGRNNGKLFYCSSLCFKSHLEEMKPYYN